MSPIPEGQKNTSMGKVNTESGEQTMTEHDEALIVIDMQHTFKAARNRRTIRNIVIAIEKAIAKDIPIFFLEYFGYAGTTKQVAAAAYGYEKLHVITKHYDDGSDELIEYLRKEDIHINCFQVCGVNSCACVAKTVNSLVTEHKKLITLIDDGCNCRCRTCDHKRLVIPDDYTQSAFVFNHANVSIVQVA